jgi:hypothetical protein
LHENCTSFLAQSCHYLPENTCKQKGLFDTLWAMNSNESPLTPLDGNTENGTFTGSSPAPRTIFKNGNG